ncbi:MAG: HAD family hydrolase [Erysipelotrichaceae bacterium]|nr:HAD family hydrolase [Erysipelotrichaceae bacterium]
MKIVFTDLDKTLLNDNHLISIQNLETIHDLMNHDIKVCFASGRSYNNIKELLLDRYDLHIPVISLNGAQIYLEDGTLLKKDPLNKKDAKEIIQICEENKLIYVLSSQNKTYTRSLDNLMENLYHLGKMKSDDIHVILKGMQIYYDIFYHYPTFDDKLIDDILKDDLYKIEIVTHKNEVLNMIKHQYSNKFYIASSADANLEINNIHVNKGNAIEYLMNYYQVDNHNVYGIGDNDNDLEMLQSVGHPIAVLNATNKVKEKAEFIVSSYDDDGFSELGKRILNNEI